MAFCSSPIFTEQNWTFPPQWCSFVIKLSNGCEVFASNDYYDDVEEEKWPANEYVSCLCFFFRKYLTAYSRVGWRSSVAWRLSVSRRDRMLWTLWSTTRLTTSYVNLNLFRANLQVSSYWLSCQNPRYIIGSVFLTDGVGRHSHNRPR